MKNQTSMETKAPEMYATENDIAKSRRSELNELMNQRLSDAIDLQMQMKQAHWNVKGPSFIALHELFDKVAEAVETYVDLVAERIEHIVVGAIDAPSGVQGEGVLRRCLPGEPESWEQAKVVQQHRRFLQGG